MTNTQRQTNILAMVQCSLFVALIAAGAFIKVPLPVVPFTLQILFTNLAGILLGKKYGTISVIIYILLGLIGLPIFTSGGGFSYVLHPTFGYMIGMAVGAYAAGYIREKIGDFKFKTTLIAGAVNVAIIYLIGLPYFIAVMKLYMDSTMAISALIMTGFVMTVPGDAIKVVISSILAKRIGPSIKNDL